MNKEVYALLGDLGRTPDRRKPERMRKLAEYLSAEDSNEVKELFSEYLAEHPDLAAELIATEEVPPEPLEPESLQLNAEDRTRLKKLLGR